MRPLRATPAFLAHAPRAAATPRGIPAIFREAYPGTATKHEFTAIVERDGDWVVACCPEIPGANGQGRTNDEARQSLAEAVELILEDRREHGLRGAPEDAERTTVTIT